MINTPGSAVADSSSVDDPLLRPFRPDIHRHLVIEDHDGLLDDETRRATLLGRGYRLIDEPDPVRLRHEAGTPDAAAPTVLILRRPPDRAPYDWWAVAHRLTLRLTDSHPMLNASVLRELTDPEQRRRLSAAVAPSARLGRRESADHLLLAVFEVSPTSLSSAAALVGWLARYHSDLPRPLPLALRARLLEQLRPRFPGWPLDDLLDDRAAFGRFVSDEWSGYLAGSGYRVADDRAETGDPPTTLGETRPTYRLDFAHDPRLQDTLPPLLRLGLLPRLAVRETAGLPDWARVAVRAPNEDDRRRRADDALARLGELADPLLRQPAAARWADWAAVARVWAELTGLALDLRADDLTEAHQTRQRQLDPAFAGWLSSGYAALAGQKLPRPHHVHHVPHLLAYELRQPSPAAGRVALLILDGLSLADWGRISRDWSPRHPDWSVREDGPLLAQLPTITAISRQALVSGRRPADFADWLKDNHREPQHWKAFWAAEGLSDAAAIHDRQPAAGAYQPTAQTRALCLIDTTLDDRLHGATMGASDAWSTLGVWLSDHGRRVEATIEALLSAGFVVYLASDHGHVEAWGIGQPRDGEAAATRGKRARLYRERAVAEAQQRKHARTRLWSDDGLLPANCHALLPADTDGRGAFVTSYQRVVTHGGLTLDEVVVPFVRIGRG